MGPTFNIESIEEKNLKLTLISFCLSQNCFDISDNITITVFVDEILQIRKLHLVTRVINLMKLFNCQLYESLTIF